ncbi:MAG TPA: serpin family protein [Planctomycetota bacterium]|nr:serpin family protein [Planctomycetota bacterium]
MRLCCVLLGAVLAASPTAAQDRQNAPPAPVDDVLLLRAAIDRFGSDLTDKLAKADQNLCVSPASIALALLMTLPGARAGTAAELQKLLCPEGWDTARTLSAVGKLLALWRAPREITLAVVNGLWPQRGHALLPEYLAAVRTTFGAEVRSVDFAHDAAGACRTINDSVAEATHDRIRDLLSTDVVKDRTRLILTNAVYFQAKWLREFGKQDTSAEAFHLAAGKFADVKTMHQQTSFLLAETGELQVLRMPYVGGEFALDVLLPREGKHIGVATAALRPEREAIWAGRLQLQDVEVALPCFRITGGFRLREALMRLGLRQAMTEGGADFRGIDGSNELYVEEVVHQTFLQVGEAGTEAAAATAVMGTAIGFGRAARPPASFVADRPFVFALRELRSGLVLFTGRVIDPRSAGA